MQITKLLVSSALFALLSVCALPLSASADTPMVRTKPVIDRMAVVQAKRAHHHAGVEHARHHARLHSAGKATQLPPRS